jgi:uncharacterized membrane protein
MRINHHRLFRHIHRTDDTFLLNGLLLMTITIVPFPTAVVAAWIRLDGAGRRLNYMRASSSQSPCFTTSYGATRPTTAGCC